MAAAMTKEGAAAYVQYAKTTRPQPTEIVSRPRLFEAIDRAIGKPIVWIAGPPGSGKTTLAADYCAQRPVEALWYQVDSGDVDAATFFYYIGQSVLQRRIGDRPLPVLSAEYLGDLETFTRRFFRDLFSRMRPPFALVFDNYQDAPDTVGLHELVRFGLSEVPPGGSIIFVGRTEPPPSFARFRANGQMSVLGWEDLKLTRREHDDIVALRNVTMDEAGLQRLYERTQGWAVGLVLLLSDAGTSQATSTAPLTPHLLFDYLGDEVFQKFDAETRDFLLRTAALPHVSAGIAARQCPELDIPVIFGRLTRFYFLLTSIPAQPETLFQYHPLVREFLGRKARELYPAAKHAEILRRAAAILNEDGQPEEAAQILIGARDWSALAELARKHAGRMLAQGRGETLTRWIHSLPVDELDADPWLVCWLAEARFATAPREATALFERAYRGFAGLAQPNLRGQFLTLAGVMDTLMHDPDDLKPLDPWIAEAERLIAAQASWPDRDIQGHVTQSLYMALVLRQPHHPKLPEWGERTMAVVASGTDAKLRMLAGLYLATTLMWTGQFARAAPLLDTMRAIADQPEISPAVLMTLRQIESMYYMLLGNQEACLDAVYDGLDIARNTGVQLWNNTLLVDGVGASLAAGDLETSAKLLQELEQRPFGTRRFTLCLYQYVSGWYALLRGDAYEAYNHARESVRFATELGAPFFQAFTGLGLAQTQIALGDYKAATEQLATVSAIALPMRSRLFEYMLQLSLAYIEFRRGNDADGRQRLRDAFALGRERGLMNAMFWLPEQMAELCARAIEAGIEPAYVRNLIQSRSLWPKEPPYELEQWPWPLRVRVLGRFDVQYPGRDPEATGRSQVRPLELLKALIAFGGRDVGLERVADAMWPRIDSDYAQRSLTTTLHRLRKLLADDGAILLLDGKLSLSARHFWLDTWALEQDLAKFARAVRVTPVPDAALLQVLVDRVFDLYRGALLEEDRDYAWAVAPRQQLHSRVLRFLVDAGRLLETHGRLEAAEGLYRRGLEIDPLAENLYRQLMVAYQRSERIAEAMETYQRCRETLRQSLQVEPSPETQTLYQAVSRPR